MGQKDADAKSRKIFCVMKRALPCQKQLKAFQLLAFWCPPLQKKGGGRRFDVLV
jgi:hypothetical protein